MDDVAGIKKIDYNYVGIGNSPSLDGVKELVFDFKDLAYISSAGLRVLLSAQKTMNKQGSMKICNVNSDIMEIFDVTGFVDILVIEQ